MTRRRQLHSAVLAVSVGLWASSTCALGTADSASLIRIPLENFDQMQFFATVHVGEQPFRVIFDTGSSDIWVPSESCRACAGIHRYHSNTTTGGSGAFELQYGSGSVKGQVTRDSLRMGEALQLDDMQIGSVTQQGHEIQRFLTEGIVGLAMPQLARVSTPSLLEMLRDSDAYQLPLVFSLYISPFPSASPSSQLVFGGVDDALAGQDASWHRFPVVSDSYSSAFGFWSLYLHEMSILDANAAAQVVLSTASVAEDEETPAQTAIVDSGTSLILLPSAAYDATIQAIQTHIGPRFRSHSHRSGGFSCRNCDHDDFPALAFAFGPAVANVGDDDRSQRFVLQGSDYVRCESSVCTPQLDVSASDIVILGDVFLRAYYTVFDYDNKQIGFACPLGSCNGGIKPPLALNTGYAQLTELGLVYLRSSLVVGLAMASLWLVSVIHARITVFLHGPRQRRASRDAEKRRSSVLETVIEEEEDEPVSETGKPNGAKDEPTGSGQEPPTRAGSVSPLSSPSA